MNIRTGKVVDREARYSFVSNVKAGRILVLWEIVVKKNAVDLFKQPKRRFMLEYLSRPACPRFRSSGPSRTLLLHPFLVLSPSPLEILVLRLPWLPRLL